MITDLINALGEFFKSPLGAILLTVLTAVGVSTVSRIRARTERANQIDAAVSESEKRQQVLILDREAQNLKLIDDIRNDWIKSQQEMAELREKYALVVERNMQLISDQRISLEGFTRVTREFEACMADSVELNKKVQAVLDKLALTQTERDTAQGALAKRNGEYDLLDVAYKKRTAEYEKLSDDFSKQKLEIEHLHSDLWETRRDLQDTKKRLTLLENKPDADLLDSAKAPDANSAPKPVEAPTTDKKEAS